MCHWILWFLKLVIVILSNNLIVGRWIFKKNFLLKKIGIELLSIENRQKSQRFQSRQLKKTLKEYPISLKLCLVLLVNKIGSICHCWPLLYYYMSSANIPTGSPMHVIKLSILCVQKISDKKKDISNVFFFAMSFFLHPIIAPKIFKKFKKNNIFAMFLGILAPN